MGLTQPVALLFSVHGLDAITRINQGSLENRNRADVTLLEGIDSERKIKRPFKVAFNQRCTSCLNRPFV